MKVLITIGTMVERKFTRLFLAVDQLCKEGILNGKDVIAQVGYDHYHSRYYKCFDFIADDKFKRLIDASDLIITHAGTGTVTSCLKKHKKVIIFPRMAKFDEHFDDHQLELAEIFTEAGYVLCATNVDELRICIENIHTFVPVEFKSNNERLNQIVIDYIENS